MYDLYTPVAHSSPPRGETKILGSIGANLRELIREQYIFMLLKILQSGLSEIPHDFPDHCAEKLLHFLELLDKWNRHYNLTAVRDLKKMIPLHILDSLSALPYLKGDFILDIGTGAGLPGIPLAISEPEKTFTLLDSQSKKIHFLQEVVTQLALENGSLVHERLENFNVGEEFDMIVTRAVGKAAELWKLSKRFLKEDGQMLLMKGQYPQEELKELKAPYQVIAVKVPQLEAERHLIVIRRDEN